MSTDIAIRNEPNINWETITDTSQRLLHAFLANEWLSDISFYVSKDHLTVPAHSLIVAAASAKLEQACFQRKGTRNRNSTIVVPDFCSANTFHIVLRYLYMGIIDNELCLMGSAELAAVIKVAHFFELDALKDQCVNRIRTTLSTDDVCAVYGQTHNLDIDLNDMCLFYMQENAKDILANGTVMQMAEEPLGKFLALDELKIGDELSVIGSMIKWADEECEKLVLAASPANRRLVLQPRLHNVRFASMSFERFMEGFNALGANFFKDNEFAQIVQHIYNPSGGASPYSSVSRGPPFSLPMEGQMLIGTNEQASVRKLKFSLKCRDSGPFLLKALRLGDDKKASDFRLKNLITSRKISFATSPQLPNVVFFSYGIPTDCDGNIRLQINCAERLSVFAFQQPEDVEVRVQDEHTCVHSFIYCRQ